MQQIKRKCNLCWEMENLTGRGKWRDDIQAFEWYESDHKCTKIDGAAKVLGTLGGLVTSKKYGVKHYSKAGKKGMKVRWGK